MSAKHPQARRRQPGQAPSVTWRRWLVPALALAVLLAGGLGAASWLGASENLPLRTVRVQGTLQHVSAAALREAVQPFTREGILRIDMDAVRQAVEALPWVRSATARRAWPDTLVVEIEEQVPFARWAAGGLLNPQGERFVPQKVEAEALPLLAGPDGTERELLQRYRELQQSLAGLGLEVRKLNMDARLAWRLSLDTGMEVMLGRNDHALRLQRFVRVYPGLLAPKREAIARVDLRYTNGLAVQWRAQEISADA